MAGFFYDFSGLSLNFGNYVRAPSDFPKFATFLVEHWIDSISLIHDTVVKARLAVVKKKQEMML